MEQLGSGGQDFMESIQDIVVAISEVSTMGGELDNPGLMPEGEVEAPNSRVGSLIPIIENYLAKENSEGEDVQLNINKVRIALLQFIDLEDIQDLSGRLKIDFVPDKSTAELLIESNEKTLIAEKLAKFSLLDLKVAKALIENGQGWAVAENFWLFDDIDPGVVDALLTIRDFLEDEGE